MPNMNLGPMPTVSGSPITVQTVTAAAQRVGPLPVGRYVIESDVDAYVLQDTLADSAGVDAAALAARGNRLPAFVQEEFEVEANDTFISWCRVSADGTGLRINCRSKAEGET